MKKMQWVMSSMWATRLAAAMLIAPDVVDAEINQFQSPATASWAAWSRQDAGSVFAEWDTMSPLVGGISNYTPDNGQYGVLQPNTVLGAELRVVPFTAGITGTFNYYSPFNVPDFDIAVFTDAAHQALSGEVVVALQVALLGTDIDDSRVTINCVVQHADDDSNASTNSFNDDADPTQTDVPLSETGCMPFDEKIVLETGQADGPDGQPGADNEYLYLWRLPQALPVYTFDLTALASSLSLDAVAIDIGPAPAVVELEHNVPLPPLAFYALAIALGLVARHRLKKTPG